MAASDMTCTVAGCDRKQIAKGLCNAHYRRARAGVDVHNNAVPIRRYGITCTVDGCSEKAYGRSLCRRHYARVRRRGTTDISGAKPGSVWAFIERAASHEGDACLTWPFSINKYGRGYLTRCCKTLLAHRVICEMAHGAPPFPKAHAAHFCGKGHEGCVNPRHMRWATAKENAADKIAHGTAPRGVNNGHAKLTTAQARQVKARIRAGETDASIAAGLPVGADAVRAIRSGRNWRWLDEQDVHGIGQIVE